MLFQVQIQPKSFKLVSVYGNCGETTQAHYMTKLYNWLMHDIIIIIIIIIHLEFDESTFWNNLKKKETGAQLDLTKQQTSR